MKKQYIRSFISYFKISPKLFLFQVVIEMNKRGMHVNLGNSLEKTIERKNDFIIKLLSDDTNSEKEKFCSRGISDDKDSKIPKKIWILWWQGEETAPPLVQTCINSMRKNNPDWEVQVLDQTNFNQFVNIDSKILQLFSDEKIRIQHLSDLIRFELLFRYGGFWVDSTLLSIKPFPDSILDYSFYTAKNTEVSGTSKYWVAIDQWVSYFIGAKPHNQTIEWIVTNLREYLRLQKPFPDYLLINYLALIGRETVPQLRKEFSEIPSNNLYIETGKSYLLNHQFSTVVDSDTTVIKLNHRDPMLLEKVIEEQRKMSV